MQVFSKRPGFFDFFPAPKFLNMPSVGIDLSDASIKFVELLATPGGVVVGRFGEENIPQGAISGGIIQNKDAVEKVITALQKKHDLSFARVACPEKETYLLELSLPFAPLASLRETISTQFEEWVPMKHNDAVFDIEITDIDEDKKEVVVQVSAVSRALADSYDTVFKNAGIAPIAFEAESQALARAVISSDEKDSALIVDIGKLETTITVVKKNGVQVTASVDGGGETITESLANTLGMSLEEAERVKRQHGWLSNHKYEDVTEVITKSFQPIEEKILQYSHYQGVNAEPESMETSVRRIIMCGGGSNIPGATEYISEKLLIPTTLANPWINTISFDEYIPSVAFSDALRYTTAIGLAMTTIKRSFDA
jgi:type IV pilus assembly protein PilM